MRPLPCRLLVVTDRRLSGLSPIETVEQAMQGGARWIWLRDRDLPEPERGALAAALMRIMQGRAVLTIGADVGLAHRTGAQGVQLAAGADVSAARACLGADAIIGVSAHHERDVRQAMRSGADYATLSPIFPTASKPGYGPALQLDTITRLGTCGLPLLALGGVTAANAGSCLDAGAAGLAVMGAIVGARDPQSATRDILNEMQSRGA